MNRTAHTLRSSLDWISFQIVTSSGTIRRSSTHVATTEKTSRQKKSESAGARSRRHGSTKAGLLVAIESR